MADILITRKHTLPVTKAREAADRFAQELDEEFDLESEWEGDTLHFRRTGVHGTLVLAAHEVTIHARLGILLSAFKGTFETHIHANLDRVFGKEGAPKKATKKKA